VYSVLIVFINFIQNEEIKMNTIPVHSDDLLTVQDDEISIINRREIIPLHAKARQVLRHYDKAMGCPAIVLDRSGKVIKTSESAGIQQNNASEVCGSSPAGEKQMRICEFCRKHFDNPSQIWKGNEFPCEKTHQAALAESRRTGEVYIYVCEAGFVYWISPLYRNRRYAGALKAGQVLSNGHNTALEKFRALCRDNNAVQIFSEMIKEVPEKTHEEIKAMAQMLGLCAKEISERSEDTCEMIRRKTGFKTWHKVNSKNPIEPLKTTAKNDQHPKGEADAEFSLEKERMLLAAFRRGDNETGGRILKELMDGIITAMPDNLEIVRFRAIELAAFLSRAAITETPDSDTLLEPNNRYLKRIQESKSAEELIENLHLVAKRMAGKIFSFQGIRHASVLRRAERYIWENYTRKISLEEISKASGLSAPYFSTIFKEEMGENFSSYLNRLRIERAIVLLSETGKPLNEIAKLCGFEDQSWFSKIFKSFTWVSPGKFRKNGGGKWPRVQNRNNQGLLSS